MAAVGKRGHAPSVPGSASRAWIAVTMPGRRLIPLLANRGEEIACMDINPQTADFSEHGKQVRVM